MIFTTHTIATIGVGKLLGIKTTRDWFLAFIFGVLVDLDHFKVFRPKYINNGDWRKFFKGELPVRSFFQEPIFVFLVIPISFYLKSPIPMASWAIHVFLDYLVEGVKRPFWPLFNLVLREGFLPNYSIYEFLITPLFLLVLFFRWGII